ncbi:MAG: M15 family metallopeptidase [Campylobacterota bacterium]
MNRRNFLACAVIAPTLSTNLMAEDNDVYLSPDEFMTVSSLNSRLKRLKRFVGFANFNLISYHQALYYGRNYSRVGAFTQKEIGMMERLFDENPNDYGFYGERTCLNLDNKVARKDVEKIPYTGHYLFKGKSEEDYKKIVSDVGDSIILTSGVRNVVKQMSLYVNKIYNCGGNMSKATISIAPPAYSYHTISDFDVGRKGWGYKNFTADFALTNEFAKMTKLDYIGMRYTMNNMDGVRFEPWHVEVI